jgi:general secretion pathway protein G
MTRMRARLVTIADEQGYTLLELLVVIAILGLLIAFVAPNVVKLLSSSKEKIAAQSIERISTILDMYRLDVGGYPTNEQGLEALVHQPVGVASWHGPYVKGNEVPLDPWGHPFQYRVPSQRPQHEFDLFSLGPTGQPGGNGENAEIYNK